MFLWQCSILNWPYLGGSWALSHKDFWPEVVSHKTKTVSKQSFKIFKVKNRPVNKHQEVRGQVSTTFSEAPNSELTVDENIFIVARLKLVFFEFQCHFFTFIPPFFDFGLVFITCTLHAKFQKKICMPTKLLLVENCSKMGAHLPEPTTWTTFGNYIYTTIVCNDTPLS